MKNILITGGAGYIGSHCAIALIKNKFNPIILDNFSNSNIQVIKNLETITRKKIKYYKIDIRNKKKLMSIFNKHKLEGVIHCAGFKAVGESIKKPLKYSGNNIQCTLSLLECMKEKKIFNLVFSSSATVYDPDQTRAIKENFKIGKTQNPYGTSKYIIEKILIDLAKYDKKWSIGILRYFNPIGNHSSGLIGDNPIGIPQNLLPYIVRVFEKKLPYLKVFGKNYNTKDGTCIRDYVHIEDLAEGHIAMLKRNKMKKGSKIFNLGTGKGHTVLDVIKIFEKIFNTSINYKFTKRRLGDSAITFCNPAKAYRELNWKARYDIKNSITSIKKMIYK